MDAHLSRSCITARAVFILRTTPLSPKNYFYLKLRPVLDGTDVSQNIDLQPFDMVVVPNSPIAEVNNWVDLYVRQNIPINFGVAVRPAFAF